MTFLDIASGSSDVSQITLIPLLKILQRSPYWPKVRAKVLTSAFTAVSSSLQSSLWPQLLLHPSLLTLYPPFWPLCCSLNLPGMFCFRPFAWTAPFAWNTCLQYLHGSVSTVRHTYHVTCSDPPWPSPAACLFLPGFGFLCGPFHLPH